MNTTFEIAELEYEILDLKTKIAIREKKIQDLKEKPEKWLPSDASELIKFMLDWCDSCARNEYPAECPLLARLLENKKIEEWLTDANSGTRCTAYR